MGKIRLDVFLVDHGHFESREKAKQEILAGNVLVDERRLKPSDFVTEKNVIRIINKMPFVSRGGYKLEKAINVFALELENKVCIDVGASTGGFTDVMLQNGAKHVFSVDVGYGQLHYKLRKDDRVSCMERYNARNMKKEDFQIEIDFASMDVSFISILLIFPALKSVLKPGGQVVALIKPQFETSKEKVGKNGVVRDPATHLEVVENILAGAKEIGYCCKGLDFSPIKGPEGNIEYIALFDFSNDDSNIDPKAVVELSHENNF